jgi:hypothetical protein
VEYPHANFIRYLASTRAERFEIAQACMDYKLIPPNDTDVLLMSRGLGIFPPTWTRVLTGSSQEFRDWLVEAGVHEMWEMSRDMQAAISLLSRHRLRQTLEALMLQHGDVAQARTEIKNSYPDHQVPSLEAFELFCFYFWDVPNMSKAGLFEYLQHANNETYALAVEADRDTVYAVLGIRQPIDPVANLDWFIQLAQLETKKHLQRGGFGTGQAAIGHSTIMKTMMDAIAMRMELSQSSPESTMRKDAQLFRAKIIERPPLMIPSIDDLQVLDAEEVSDEEENSTDGATIHRLPTRR